MSPQNAPILDSLKGDARPAWLWDPDRLRLVWANAPGLAFWRAESLFDILDRRFDRAEPGVDRAVELSGSLRDDTSVEEDFLFPSSGRKETMRFRCSVHALEDGRRGLLMVAEAVQKATAHGFPDAGAIEALPIAVALFDPTGALISHNQAARDVFAEMEDGTPIANLSVLLGSSEEAATFIARAEDAGMVSEVRTIATRWGERTHRINARKTSTGVGGDALIVVFDDITERRQHERALLADNEKLTGFVTAASDFTFELDKHLNWTGVSDGFAPATGLSTAELVGRSFSDTANIYGFDPDGRIVASCRARNPFRARLDWRHDSRTVAILLCGAPLTTSLGEFAGYRGTGTRIAEPYAAPASAPSLDPASTVPATGAAPANTATRSLTERAIAPTEAKAEVEVEAAGAAETKPETEGPEAVSPALDEGDEKAFEAIGEAITDGDMNVADDAGSSVQDKAMLDAAYAKLREMLDLSPAGVIVCRAYQAKYANQRAADLLGTSSLDALLEADDLRDLFPSGAAALTDLLGADADAELPEEEVVIDLEVRYADNRPVQVRCRAHRVEWQDGPAVELLLSEAPKATVTGPREGELETILNTATDGIITLDETGAIVTLNTSAEAILGSDQSEIQGKEFASFMTEDSARAVRDYLASLADSGIASIFNDGREVVAVEKNGGEIPLFLTIGRMKSEDGGVTPGVTFCAVVRDITQWKKTEADLRSARDRAERASTQKSEFLANISHELRTPLNAIIGFSEVMTTEKFGPLSNDRYKGYVNDIHSSGGHLLSLINDLLDLSKVEAGKLELDFTSVNLADIIQQCIGIMQPEASRERIIIRSSVSEKLPPVVADQRSIRQIVLNLLSNAIKFTDAGGQVIVSALSDDSGRVQIRVKDTGIGMSEDELERALEPFRQIERPGRGQTKGTGLGLPLTKALTEANRAEFTIESEPENGTLVQITFPTTRVLAE